jgi:hypothetical protein
MEWVMKTIFKALSVVLSVFLLAGCAAPLHNAAADGDVATLKKMLDSGADVNENSTGSMVGGPPLHHASYYCQTEAVRLLLERGADVNAPGNNNFSALHYAVWNGCNEVVNLLIDNGADIDAASAGGASPLAWAAMHRQTGAVKLLIERGADADVATGYLLSRNKDAVAKLVQTIAKGVQDRKTQIAAQRNQAAASAGTPLPAGEAPSRKVSPVITSDIDELPAARSKPNRNAYAIVIGIENYRRNLPKADYAAQDARLVAAYLIKVMGYPEENVVTLVNENATNVDLAKYFEKWLSNNVEKDGTVFVYYSGHGAPNPRTGSAYLVPYDGDPSFIDQTGYSLQRMYDALGRLKAKEIIVALDSCFSGAGGRSVLAEGARPLVINLQSSLVLPGNIKVMAAASGDQISSTYKNKGHGLFTYFMLKGIKNKDVMNPDGSIRMDDLFGYIGPQVERIARKHYNNEQTPQLIGAPGKH